MFNKNSSQQDLLVKRIRECDVFSGLSTGEIKTMLEISHIRDYSEGEKIFEEGTIGLCFYIIVNGSVKIVSDNGGKTTELKDFKEGEYFSEVHLFSETFHTVSCVSSEVTKLIVFAMPDFEDLMKVKPKIGNKVLIKFLDFFGRKIDELYKENKELIHKLHK
jgi:CRP-like cAMP-binding protein